MQRMELHLDGPFSLQNYYGFAMEEENSSCIRPSYDGTRSKQEVHKIKVSIIGVVSYKNVLKKFLIFS